MEHFKLQSKMYLLYMQYTYPVHYLLLFLIHNKSLQGTKLDYGGSDRWRRGIPWLIRKAGQVQRLEQ